MYLPLAISFDCLPAVRPRSMGPDFSHSKGNLVQFTKFLINDDVAVAKLGTRLMNYMFPSS